MRHSTKSLVFLVGFLFIFIVVLQFLFPAYCKQAVPYSIGVVDERFGLSPEDFLQVIQKAEAGWEDASGRELFTFDPNAEFTINLIYDSRQERTDHTKTVESSLELREQEQENIKKQYDALYAAYTKAQQTYNQNAATYEADVMQLNGDIQKSNTRGGASQVEYEEFQNRQKGLDARREILEQERVALVAFTSQINSLASEEQKVVQTYNAEVEKFKHEYGDDLEFGQGEYTGNSIVVYEFTDTKDLLLVLEHEFGHVLGIEHLPNEASVMYYLVHNGNTSLDGPTADDIEALEVQCKKTSVDIFLEQFKDSFRGLVLQ